MSETVSAGAAASVQSASPGGAAAGGSGQSQTSQTSSGGQGVPAQASRGQVQASPGGEAPQAAQERLLAEQDLDAYIEHTINGRKEKIKVRDALNGYGLDKVARQRISESSRKEQQFNQVMHLLKNDFSKFCEVTGTDPNEFLKANLEQRKDLAIDVVARQYELDNMEPNQRRAMELENQIKQMQSRELQTKQPIIDKIKELVPADRLPKGLEKATAEELKGFLAQRQQEFTQGVDTLSNELLDAWQKVGLPKEKDFGQWMAQVMLDHDKRSAEHRKKTGEEIPPLHPEQAALKVKGRFLNSTRSLFSQMDATAIHEALGPEIIQKLRDHDVGLASQQNGPNFGAQNRPAITAASEPKKQLSQVEWRKVMGIS